jgi:NAD(P)-dependent dehydrogenase (short-subunit alcohol dehydrogenase family)
MSKKVIVITGASGALGRAVIKVLSRKNKSYEYKFIFALLDINTDSLTDFLDTIGISSENFRVYKSDITDDKSIKKDINKIVDEFSAIDVLLHIAGTYRGGKPIYEAEIEDFDFLMSLNTRSFILLTKAIVPIMKKKKFGRIITIGSRNVLTIAPAKSGFYTATKAALVKLTETLAYEVINDNITVNSIVPSVLDTEMNRKFMPGKDFSQWVDPINIGHLIEYLISDKGKDITGASIPVYGRVH